MGSITVINSWQYGYFVVGIAQHQEILKWKVAAAVGSVSNAMHASVEKLRLGFAV